MYVCMYFCIYVRMYVCMHACMYVCLLACLLVCFFVSVLGVLPPWHPTIMQGTSLPRPPLWGGLGVVCMYLRRLVGIGMYVCM